MTDLRKNRVMFFLGGCLAAWEPHSVMVTFDQSWVKADKTGQVVFHSPRPTCSCCITLHGACVFSTRGNGETSKALEEGVAHAQYSIWGWKSWLQFWLCWSWTNHSTTSNITVLLCKVENENNKLFPKVVVRIQHNDVTVIKNMNESSMKSEILVVMFPTEVQNKAQCLANSRHSIYA